MHKFSTIVFLLFAFFFFFSSFENSIRNHISFPKRIKFNFIDFRFIQCPSENQIEVYLMVFFCSSYNWKNCKEKKKIIKPNKYPDYFHFQNGFSIFCLEIISSNIHCCYLLAFQIYALFIILFFFFFDQKVLRHLNGNSLIFFLIFF